MMVYSGVIEFVNEADNIYAAEVQAIQQMDRLKEDLRQVLCSAVTLNTRKEEGKFITKFMIKYVGPYEDSLNDEIHNHGINYVDFKISYDYI